jgi:hypothetical protein
MDTSNSENMVSPVSVILGDQQFSQTSLSHDDWVLILNEALGEMKPRLKYLHGFVELKDHLNCTLDRPGISFVANISDEHVVKITAPSVSGKTRVIRVCFLPSLHKNLSDSHLDFNDYWHDLLLTQSGDLLELVGHYVRDKHHHQGTQSKYLVEKIKIDQVTFAELPLLDQSKRSTQHTVAAYVLNHLFGLLELAVKVRQEHVDEMKESLDKIQSMRNHIQSCYGSMLRGY